MSRDLDESMVSFNQTERSIARLCRHFFGIEHVGSRDHFFDDMGAASLDIVRLNGKLKEILNRDIPVERWFEYPTIASLAEYLDNSAPTPEPMRPTEKSSHRAEKTFKLMRRKKHD
jgi:acyl carrier protein